ncbi:MAG: amidohydrolase family protein, partial [Planctomycetes bacterium]|nr:amidohydrolase family protein [Planctomycetota bacterium]
CMLFAYTVLCAEVVDAQLPMFERATVVKNARILIGDGSVIEKGSLLIQKGRIAAIGRTVKAPLFAQRIDAAGKTVTPGLIDAWSALGLTGQPSATTGATARAWDGFDSYALDGFRDALRNGVTAVYVGPRRASGIAGIGTIVRLELTGGSGVGEVMVEDSALVVNLASDERPIARLKTLDAVRKAFRTAVEYREALEDYDEELEEYLEALEKRREKEKTEEEDDNGKGEEESSDDDPKPDTPSPEDPEPEPEDEDDDDAHFDARNGVANASRARGRETRNNTAPGDQDGASDDDEKPKPDSDGDGDGKAEESEEKEDDEDGPEKPEKPAPDRDSDVLLRAIDHELPVRVRAQRSEDILNALALAEEFNLEILLEGATEAYLVADLIAAADVAVILGSAVRRPDLDDPTSQYRRHAAINAAALDRAGVEWTIGSGAETPETARFVGLNAQSAVAATDARVDWLNRVTVIAARVLRVERRIGRLQPGWAADLVIWDGDPGDPASKVERVFVAGKPAYVAPHIRGR